MKAAISMGRSFGAGMQADSGTMVWEAKQDIWSNWAMEVSPLWSRLVPSNCDMTNLLLVRQRFGLPMTQFSHLPQVETKAMTTRSPGATEVTPSPTSSTVPAASWPRDYGKGALGVAVHEVEVAAADSGRADLDLDFASPGWVQVHFLYGRGGCWVHTVLRL